MKKIKRIIDKISKRYSEYLNKYFVTNIGLITITLFAIIFGLESANDIVNTIFWILVCFIPLTLIVETSFKKDDKRRLYLYILSVFLSIIGGIILFNNKSMIVYDLFIGIILILVIMSVYQVVKNRKDSSNYLCKVFFNLFKVELFTGILVVGFGIIYLIVELLIIEGYNIEFYDKILYFIIGIYNIPFTIMSFENVKEEVPAIINSLIRRVLLILLDISYVVIIVYILKIVFTMELPENQVFFVVFLLFAFTYPMLIMLGNYEGKIEKFNTDYLPYIFIAPLILQVYSLSLRISVYGITASRYLGLFIIVFEMIAMFLYLFKNKKYLNVNLFVLAGMAFVLFVMPYVNIYEAPIYFQVNRLTNIWTEKTSESDITKDNRQVIKDIYEYLLDYEDADRYMPKHLNMNKINKYLMNTRTKYEGLQARYFVYTRIEKPIDISNYKAMEKFYYEGRSVKLEDMNVVLGNEEYSIENLVNTLMKDEQQENEIVLTTNSGNAFLVERFDFYFNEKEDVLENVTLEGYLLYR